jgi:hypothetical protein
MVLDKLLTAHLELKEQSLARSSNFFLVLNIAEKLLAGR